MGMRELGIRKREMSWVERQWRGASILKDGIVGLVLNVGRVRGSGRRW